ncbi:long-chain-fatty-acid--CoA ligase 1-like isoform X2 [Pectinophora gossypiella]|nr:long-chain-fatty-acid--CoA ligase 1-like isoform X2 [Pectinophora gossypiella]
MLTGIAAIVKKCVLNKSTKPYFTFNDQCKVEPGPEKIHSSKLYKEPNGNEFHIYFDEDTRTLYEAFRRGLRESNNGNCLGWREGPAKLYVWQSYKETMTRSQNFGSGLLNLGLAPGENTLVGIYLKNCPEWVMVEQAAYCYSMVVVPLYDTSDAASCSFVVEQTQMSVIVCENDEKVNVLLEQLPHCVKKIISIKEVLPSTYERARAQKVDIFTFNEVESMGAHNVHACIPPKPEDLCTICYTSGTTGMPKGVMLTHANIIACISGVSVHLGDNKLNSKDVTLSFLPLSHMLERFFQQCIYIVGGAVGFYSGDIRNLTDDLKTLRPTVMPAVPRLLNKMYDRAQADIVAQSRIKKMIFNMALRAKQAELNRGIIRKNSIWDKLVFRKMQDSTGGRLRYMFVSSAPLAGSVLTFVRCALSCQVVESYGQTECTASMATTIWGEHVPDHVGPPIPCCKIKLVDVPEMDYYADKNQGEVCVKGANVFKGYYKDPEKTNETIDEEGWLHTGDIGMWLPNATLKIIDRKKHIFKLSQGEYVAPEKIQNIYLRSQYVEQVFVYGESLKSCLIAVVVPVKDVITSWAADHGIQGSIKELCQHKRVKEVIMESMQQCGKAAGLKHFEQVKDIHLHYEPFTSTNGLLTPTMKSKRPETKNFFRKQLQDMYRRLD